MYIYKRERDVYLATEEQRERERERNKMKSTTRTLDDK